VAVLVPKLSHRSESVFLLELLLALDLQLRETGRSIAIFAVDSSDDECAAVCDIVENRLADALVMSGARVGDERVRFLLERGFPFATFGRTKCPDKHPWVEVDYRRAGELAVETLASASPSELHVLSAPSSSWFAHQYVCGVKRTALEYGLPMPVIHECEMTEAAGNALATAVLTHAERPALACLHDTAAFGIFRAANTLGLKIGSDVAVCGGQNLPGSEYAAPPLTTFSTEDALVVKLLAEVLLDRLDGAASGSLRGHTVQPLPILRQSHHLS
jgi:DNA-binding LacI/PurR family transcriptional regulator